MRNFTLVNNWLICLKCHEDLRVNSRDMFREQGWRSCENSLSPMWPGFESGSVLQFVGGFCLSPISEGFSPGSPVFLPLQKSTSPNSNSTSTEDPLENQLRLT